MLKIRLMLITLLASLLALPAAYAASDYAKTRYPIVLVHGLTGAKTMLGVVEYFYGIPNKLKQNGNNQVYVATISAFSGEDIRVAQLEAFVEGVLQQTGADKVNLIGHSQGGFTIRGYAALHPEHVASITAVATPHHGTPVADSVAKLNVFLEKAAPGLRDAIVWLAESFGWLNAKANGLALEQDALGSLHLLSTPGAEEFAANVHNIGLSAKCNGARDTIANGVFNDEKGNQVSWQYPIYSWVGSGAPLNLFKSGKDLLDPTASGMTATHFAIKHLLGGGNNDGMVPVCSAQLGDVIAANYYWSHLDEVNQLMGLTPASDPRMAFVAHANRLKQKGL